MIFACMRGGPSHVDTFDYKPALAKDDGKKLKEFGSRKLLQSPWKFNKHGQSGLEISELYPQLARHADKLCVLNGMYADIPNHPQCFVQLHTGSFQFVRPSLGSWALYGLGTENQNLPGFVTINPPSRAGSPELRECVFASYLSGFTGWLARAVSQGCEDRELGNKRLSETEQRKQLTLSNR